MNRIVSSVNFTKLYSCEANILITEVAKAILGKMAYEKLPRADTDASRFKTK